ncbi:ATP-grasp domain-containing protein [Nonomuraea sp. B10E15]|uniref:ATP-grasp domain-containing protein n=1 Tax=Nonomuraea sp. B10E15 TaxID=3153560 RepID=UPI00325F0E6A
MTATLLLVESNSTGTGPLFARRARELGARPLLLATDPDRYGYAREHRIETRRVDTGDAEAVLRAARDVPDLAGVTTSSEYYVPAAAQVAAELGLPGPDPAAVTACRHKGRQRDAMAAAGVPSPRHAAAASAREAVTAARAIGYPVVVKPAAGSGSTGVLKCSDDKDVAGHAESLLAVTANERGLPVEPLVLVEEYVRGPEFSVETFAGFAVAVVAKHLGPAPYFVEIGHDLPAGLPYPEAARMRQTAEHAVRGLGLGFGAAHVELRLTEDGPRVIEVNCRLAGGMIPEMVRRASGLDLVTAQVAAALGARVRLTPVHDRHACIRFLVSDLPAVLDGPPDTLGAATRLPGVEEITLYRGRGDRLRPARDFRDRIGHVLTVSDRAEESSAAAAAALDCLRTAIRPLPEGVSP